MTDKVSKILVTAAVRPELDPLIQTLALKEKPRIGGRDYFEGLYKGITVGVLITGPGMINASQAHTAALEKACPHLIIHTGCAGIFTDTGGGPGDLALAVRDIDIHTGIERNDFPLPSALPFSLLDTNQGPICGTYPLSRSWTGRAQTILEPKLHGTKINLFKGPFITVSTVTATEKKATLLSQTYSPVMESMEGAAAAHVALHYNVPMLEIRAASNWVGKRDKASWNLPLSFERCSSAVFHVIDCL